MAILFSDILANVRATLLDPSPGVYWPDAEMLGYGNQAVRAFLGWKPDLNAVRLFVDLVAGSEQSIPTDGMQFLDAYVTGDGKPVFMVDMETAKHAKFANLTKTTAVQYPKAVAHDPRQPKKYWVFPRATGASSALEILYAAYATALTAVGNTWPLPDETMDPAYYYILSLCYAKSTDRQDLNKSKENMAACRAWFNARNAAQFGEEPKAEIE